MEHMKYKQNPFIEIMADYDIVERSYYTKTHHKENFLHFSEQIQIFYDRTGGHRVTVDEIQYQTKAGDLILVQPWSLHWFECLKEDCRYALIQFLPNMFDVIESIPQIKTDIGYWFKRAGKSHLNFLSLNEKQKQKIEGLFDKYDSHGGYGFDIMRFCTFTETLLYVSICFKKNAEIKEETSYKPSLSQKVIDYIDKHFTENIKISDIATVLFVNEKYLCTAFKRQTGMTVKQYINHCQVHQAKKILSDTRKTPQDAFEKSGFKYYPTFYRMFKKATGMTPTYYQKFDRKQLEDSYPPKLKAKMLGQLPED